MKYILIICILFLSACGNRELESRFPSSAGLKIPFCDPYLNSLSQEPFKVKFVPFDGGCTLEAKVLNLEDDTIENRTIDIYLERFIDPRSIYVLPLEDQ